MNTEWAKDISCRYITLYGFCKNENNGCPYNHNFATSAAVSQAQPQSQPMATAGENLSESNSFTTNAILTTPIPNMQPVQPKGPVQQITKGESAINELKRAVSALKLGTSVVGAAPTSNPASITNGTPISTTTATATATATATTTTQFDPLKSPAFKPAFPSIPPANLQNIDPPLSSPAMFNPYAENFIPNHLDALDHSSNKNLLFMNPSAPPSMGHPLQMSQGSSQIPIVGNIQDPVHQQVQSQAFNSNPLINNLQQTPMTPLAPMGSPAQALRHTANDPSMSFAEHHLYNPDPPPHRRVPLEPHQRTPQMLFISNTLRTDLLDKNKDLVNIQPHNVPGLPSVLNDYFNISFLYCKDSNNFFYKCISNHDGLVCLIHRISNYTEETVPQPKRIASAFQTCSNVHSNNIIQLKDVFLTTQFGDSSMCLVYDYHPLTISLNDFYRIENGMGINVEEEYFWLYLVQITNVLRKLHNENLYFGDLLNFDNFLITNIPGRIKFLGLGRNNLKNEVINLKELQQQDFQLLGIELQKIIDPKIVENSLILKQIFDYLLNNSNDNNNHKKSVEEFIKIFAIKFFDIMENLQSQTEYVEQELSKELENGRLFRLMCKLNSVINRPESATDINWSENGSKYPLKLFYHYVFHQQDSNNKKTLDLVHILKCLNKLDTGVNEKILLVTPDEMSCMLISYKELKNLMDFSFKNIV